MEQRIDPALLVTRFPLPGQHVALAYHELDQAENGTDEDRAALGRLDRLPRPWDPATCLEPRLRNELWAWLDDVVAWINHNHVFDPVDAIPACWPHHPHLVNDLAVLADQRRRAAYTYTSDALNAWQQTTLPVFLDRMRHKVADHCEDTHPARSPSAGRLNRYTAASATRDRTTAFGYDLQVAAAQKADKARSKPRLSVVDNETGEVFD